MLPANQQQRLRLSREFAAENSGSSMVEFAASASVVLLLLLGVMECSRAMYVQHFVTNAARDASRYAMVRGSFWSGTSCTGVSTPSCMASSDNVSSYVASTVPPGIKPSLLTVTTTWPGTAASGACDTTDGSNSSGCLVRVDVTYNFTIFLPLPVRSIQFKSRSVTTISR
ncbi:MAG: TadE/TadG family type IV pilus assembly protein [Acidobacteriaceae bacterium]|nr:TadE/TadG family type IV pilus assembly protein [Acidobacteriaceae bacterium]